MRELFGKSTVSTAVLLSSLLWSYGAQAQTADTGEGHVWDTYVNARFAYSICYPGDVLLPQEEAANGDGRVFITKDGKSEARVYGSYFGTDEDQTLKKEYLREIQFYQSEGFTITYKFLKNDRFVISGSRSEKILHQKTVVVKGVFKTLRFEYTDDVKQKFDTIISRMSSCFRTKLTTTKGRMWRQPHESKGILLAEIRERLSNFYTS